MRYANFGPAIAVDDCWQLMPNRREEFERLQASD